MRTQNLPARLRAAGISRAETAASWLEGPHWAGLTSCEGFWQDLAQSADPEQALLGLVNLVERAQLSTLPDYMAQVSSLRRRLLGSFGLSRFLADYLASHPRLALNINEPLPGFEKCETNPVPSGFLPCFWDGEKYDEQSEREFVAEYARAVHEKMLRCVGAVQVREGAWVAQSVGELEEGLAHTVGRDDLRRAYRKQLARIVALDAVHPHPLAVVSTVSALLSALTDATLEAALALARAEHDPSAEVEISVIALGKTGAQELNYLSDIDVVYVAEPWLPADEGVGPGEMVSPERDTSSAGSLSEAQALARAELLIHALSAAINGPGQELGLWTIDLALRPEGKDGSLVRTLHSHMEYYRRWAKNWEFQAQLKARPAAGSRRLGQAYVRELSELVWSASSREGFVEESRAMRKRVEQYIPKSEVDREIKLAPGGLRDIEFSIQLLQLIHGKVDSTLRVRSTLGALSALVAGGYISRADGEEMARAYRFLRCVEHRVQMQGMKRTHLFPQAGAQADLRRIGRSIYAAPRWFKVVGMVPAPQAIKPSAGCTERLIKEWKSVRPKVRSLQQEIFYRPLLLVTAQLSVSETRLDEEGAKDRLRAMGFLDTRGALEHIRALTSGVSRRAKIARHLLPVLLNWLSDGPAPDAGLLRFRRLSEQIGSSEWYMRLLRDSSVAAQRLCEVLSVSPFVAGGLEAIPEAVKWLADDSLLVSPGREALEGEMQAICDRYSAPDEVSERVRAIRFRELLRCAMCDVVGNMDAVRSQQNITLINDVTVGAVADVVRRQLLEESGMSEREFPALAVIAMGRGGGEEYGYASDGDLMVLFDSSLTDVTVNPTDGLPAASVSCSETHSEARDLPLAVAFATRLRDLLSSVGESPAFAVDYDLRPEGRKGLLARSLQAYADYYSRWSSTWEAQALLRARPVWATGDLGERFVELIYPYRYPCALEATQLMEIRRLKARMEKERIPGGREPTRHVKLGPGGLSDVEWTVQLLQLLHAWQVPSLRTTNTLRALSGAKNAGLLDGEQEQELREAWVMASRIRNGNVLISGRVSGHKLDYVPSSAAELKCLASLLGYEEGCEGELVEDYLRFARRARSVMSSVFYARDASSGFSQVDDAQGPGSLQGPGLLQGALAQNSSSRENCLTRTGDNQAASSVRANKNATHRTLGSQRFGGQRLGVRLGASGSSARGGIKRKRFPQDGE